MTTVLTPQESVRMSTCVLCQKHTDSSLVATLPVLAAGGLICKDCATLPYVKVKQ